MKIIALTRSAPSSIVTLRLVLQGGGDVPVVAVLVLALDGVDRDAEVLHQAGGDVVLGGQRVGGDEHEVGAAGLEGPGQVGRLGGDVQAGRHPQARQRLLVREPLADGPQDGHVPLGPHDPLVADARQRQILHVTRYDGCQAVKLLNTEEKSKPPRARPHSAKKNPIRRRARLDSRN